MKPAFHTDEGTGTPLLLVHAFPLTSAMWEAQRLRLRGHCRVLTFDIPGFGRGGPVFPDQSIDHCADMAVALLDELGIERAVLCGCSMGGYIALGVLRRHPARLARLILANTRVGADSEEGAAGRMAQIERIRAGEFAAVLDGMRPRLLGATTHETAPEVPRLVEDITAMATPEGAIAMLRAMAQRPDSTEALRHCPVPVLSIGGAEDVLIPPSEAEHIAALAPDATLRIIQLAGHLSNLERPAKFTDAVKEFLLRCESPG